MGRRKFRAGAWWRRGVVDFVVHGGRALSIAFDILWAPGRWRSVSASCVCGPPLDSSPLFTAVHVRAFSFSCWCLGVFGRIAHQSEPLFTLQPWRRLILTDSGRKTGIRRFGKKALCTEPGMPVHSDCSGVAKRPRIPKTGTNQVPGSTP